MSPPNTSPVDEMTTNSESSTGTLNLVQSQSLNNVSNDSASTNDGGTTNIRSTTVHVQPSQQIRSKLPKFVLPKFKGDITQFRMFWDSFESAVHNNPGLTTINKFNHLNSQLEGFAFRTVQGLPITEGNYQSAVDILQPHYFSAYGGTHENSCL